MDEPLAEREIAALDMLQAMVKVQALAWAAQFVPDHCEVLRTEIQPVPSMWRKIPSRAFLKFEVVLGNFEKPSSPAFPVSILLTPNGWAAIGKGMGFPFFETQSETYQKKVLDTLVNCFTARFQRHPKIRWTGRPALYGDGSQSWIVGVEHHHKIGYLDQFEVFLLPSGESEVEQLAFPPISVENMGEVLTVESVFFGFDGEGDNRPIL